MGGDLLIGGHSDRSARTHDPSRSRRGGSRRRGSRRELGDETGEVQTLNIVGLCYTGLADYSRALDHYLQCLNIYEKLGISSKVELQKMISD